MFLGRYNVEKVTPLRPIGVLFFPKIFANFCSLLTKNVWEHLWGTSGLLTKNLVKLTREFQKIYKGMLIDNLEIEGLVGQESFRDMYTRTQILLKNF